MLATVIHMFRGTPYVYQGEELGMTNPHYGDISQYRDVESINYYRILTEQGITGEEALKVLAARSGRPCSGTAADMPDFHRGSRG